MKRQTTSVYSVKFSTCKWNDCSVRRVPSICFFIFLQSLLLMAEVKMIRELPSNPSVAIEMTGASLAWETGGHSAQPTPRGTPYVGLGMRGCRKKRRQRDDPKHHGMLEEETHGQLLNDVSADMASSHEDQTLQVPTISQRLQRTLHCIDLSIQKVFAFLNANLVMVEITKTSHANNHFCVWVFRGSWSVSVAAWEVVKHLSSLPFLDRWVICLIWSTTQSICALSMLKATSIRCRGAPIRERSICRSNHDTDLFIM